MSHDEPNPKRRPDPALWAKLRPLVKAKRRNPTPAERALWARLRGDQVAGAHFRRQHAIGPFIVDFFCAAARLVVEVDGPIHDLTPEDDAARQSHLEALGLRVIRFTNDAVLGEIDGVIAVITAALDESAPEDED